VIAKKFKISKPTLYARIKDFENTRTKEFETKLENGTLENSI
jgi:hypothetical protein